MYYLVLSKENEEGKSHIETYKDIEYKPIWQGNYFWEVYLKILKIEQCSVYMTW